MSVPKHICHLPGALLLVIIWQLVNMSMILIATSEASQCGKNIDGLNICCMCALPRLCAVPLVFVYSCINQFPVGSDGMVCAGDVGCTSTPTVQSVASTASSTPIDITHVELDFVHPGDYAWMCPAGVFFVQLYVIGGGGAGSMFIAGSGGGGGGGGGGLIESVSFPVTPGKLRFYHIHTQTHTHTRKNTHTHTLTHTHIHSHTHTYSVTYTHTYTHTHTHTTHTNTHTHTHHTHTCAPLSFYID